MKKFLAIFPLLTASAINAAVFQWTPLAINPSPNYDVIQAYQIETLAFNCTDASGVQTTDIMPVWINEDGVETVAISGSTDPMGIDPTRFEYQFRISDFKCNGEYILRLPEGLLVDADGNISAQIEIPYTFDVPELAAGMFDDFNVISIDPDLSQPQGVWNDKKITIDTNHNNAIGLTLLTITDETDNEVIAVSSNFATGRQLGNPEAISWNVAGSYKFLQQHQYSAQVVFYNGRDAYGDMGQATPIVGRASFSFEGKVEGYHYSDISLLGVTPDTDFFISQPDDAVFSFSFSGPVNIYQVETPLGSAGIHSYPDNCLSCNSDKTIWTLDLSNNAFAKTLATGIVINIYARDLDGAQLKGNCGSENNSCFQFSWDCELGAIPLEAVAPVQGVAIDRLSEVTVKAANGDKMSWSWNGSANVCSNDGSIVGQLVFDSDKSNLKEVSFNNWITPDGSMQPISLTKPGDYKLVFSYGCFIFGEQFDTNVSHSFESDFSITGVQDPSHPSQQETLQYSEISIDPNTTVESLSEVALIFPEIVKLANNSAEVFNTDSSDDTSVVCNASISRATYLWTRIIVTLPQPIITDGNYMIFIPKRSIGNEEFFESNETAGKCNPDIALEYTVKSIGNKVDLLTGDNNADIFDINGQLIISNASPETIKSLPKGIYVIRNKKIILN